jgi:hypothetical protein
MQPLDAVQVGQRKGEPFPFFGCDELSDIDRMNRLIAGLIATTVAKWFPASGKTGEKNICHNPNTSCHAETTCGWVQMRQHQRCSNSFSATLQPPAMTDYRHYPGACQAWCMGAAQHTTTHGNLLTTPFWHARVACPIRAGGRMERRRNDESYSRTYARWS